MQENLSRLSGIALSIMMLVFSFGVFTGIESEKNNILNQKTSLHKPTRELAYTRSEKQGYLDRSLESDMYLANALINSVRNDFTGQVVKIGDKLIPLSNVNEESFLYDEAENEPLDNIDMLSLLSGEEEYNIEPSYDEVGRFLKLKFKKEGR